MENKAFSVMVNGAERSADHSSPALAEGLAEAERLALAAAPRRSRARYGAVLLLDAALRRIALSARDPLPTQFRLAWWRDAVGRVPPGREHPVLAALTEAGFAEPAPLVALVDAWEAVAVGEDRLALRAEALARARGQAFSLCAGTDPVLAIAAARCWTLVELAATSGDPGEGAALLATARHTSLPPLPRDLRPLALLAGLARRAALRGGEPLLGDRLSPLAAIRLHIFGR